MKDIIIIGTIRGSSINPEVVTAQFIEDIPGDLQALEKSMASK